MMQVRISVLADYASVSEGHKLSFHPKHPELFATVARHNPLAIGYVSHAVRLIDRLKELESCDG
jgi:hypothetical protein